MQEYVSLLKNEDELINIDDKLKQDKKKDNVVTLKLDDLQIMSM